MKIRDLKLVAVPACIVAVIVLQLPIMDDGDNIAKTGIGSISVSPVDSQLAGNSLPVDDTNFIKPRPVKSPGVREDEYPATTVGAEDKSRPNEKIETVTGAGMLINGNQAQWDAMSRNGSGANADTQTTLGKVSADRVMMSGNMQTSNSTIGEKVLTGNTATTPGSLEQLSINRAATSGIIFSDTGVREPAKHSNGAAIIADTGSRTDSNSGQVLQVTGPATSPTNHVNSSKSDSGNIVKTEPSFDSTGTLSLSDVAGDAMDPFANRATNTIESQEVALDGTENTTNADMYAAASDSVKLADMTDLPEVAVNDLVDSTKASAEPANNPAEDTNSMDQQEENVDGVTTPPGTMLYPFDEGNVQLVAADYLEQLQYKDYTGEIFWLSKNMEDPPIRLTLREVIKLSENAFMLKFRTPDTQSLPQKTFKIDHATLGPMALFTTSAANANGKRTFYTAIINKDSQ